MNNTVFQFEAPKNEPTLHYAPGAPERARLKAELARQAGQEIEIPLIIGGREVRTGKTGQVVMPCDHGHVLATYHKATPREVTMAIDIGTNTEIAVGNRDGILVTSCASGPAFEGSGIGCGTGSVEGAIQRLAIESGGRITYETIGDGPPVGICGSGLIDTLAELLEHGIIDRTGKFTGGVGRFSLAEGEKEVYLDGSDLDNLKLAKAAVGAGAAVLLEHAGIGAGSLARLYLAGAFGTYIDVTNAKRIGMLPGIPPERVVKVGNASIEGAALALLSRDCRKRGEELAGEITHVSLEQDPAFQDRFVEELCFSDSGANR